MLDFHHASEYVTQAADALCAERPAVERQAWLEERGSMLQHDWDGARQLLAERRKMLEESIRHFGNHLHQMHYRRYQDRGWPIARG